MDSIRDQMAVTKEISEAISGPIVSGVDLDEDELEDELKGLEEEVISDRLRGAEHVPAHTPASPIRDSVERKCIRFLMSIRRPTSICDSI